MSVTTAVTISISPWTDVPDRSDQFNPTRLRLARKRRGFTQTAFARRMGLDRRSVTAFESGEFPPSERTIDKLAAVLEFPREFFFGDDLDEPLPQVASFRSLSKMSATTRDMALAEGAIAMHLSDWIERTFKLPEPALPDLSREINPDSTPEAAAATVRQLWGLGERPIKSMVHLLESKGVRLFALSTPSLAVDAFSMWRESTPLMFLNTQKSSERSRFDAGHEFGHLVLHRHVEPQGERSEREANDFASALLMPRGSMFAYEWKTPQLSTLIKVKKRWGVSLAALAYRLHALGLLSDWHYRQLYVEMNKRGYKETEPDPAPRESSLVLRKVFEELRADGCGKADIASRLSIGVTDLDNLILGLVTTSLPSGGRPIGRAAERSRADLRIVE